MPDFCVICGIPVSLGNKLLNAFTTPTRGRCQTCAVQSKVALERFRARFNQACSGGFIPPATWQEMWNELRASRGISHQTWHEDGLRYIENDVKRFLEWLMQMAYADGIITPDESDKFNKALMGLLHDELQRAPFRSRWAELVKFSEVRQGRLPVIRTNLHLDSGELCHLQERSQFVKNTAKGIVLVPGQLVATSKRVHFLASDASGWTIQYDRIMRLNAQSAPFNQGALTFELSTKKGAGTYNIGNVEWAELVLTALVRMSKRQIVGGGSRASRHVPHDVQTAVWQRDAGKCVQCGAAEYLEFDHIIPHSKGGASSINNVQLLCRRCNQQKSDRI